MSSPVPDNLIIQEDIPSNITGRGEGSQVETVVESLGVAGKHILTALWRYSPLTLRQLTGNDLTILARAVGVPVSRCSGGRQATILLATINVLFSIFVLRLEASRTRLVGWSVCLQNKIERDLAQALKTMHGFNSRI